MAAMRCLRIVSRSMNHSSFWISKSVQGNLVKIHHWLATSQEKLNKFWKHHFDIPVGGVWKHWRCLHDLEAVSCRLHFSYHHWRNMENICNNSCKILGCRVYTLSSPRHVVSLLNLSYCCRRSVNILSWWEGFVGKRFNTTRKIIY